MKQVKNIMRPGPAVFAAFVFVLAGCSGEPDIAELTCSDWDKITTEAQRAELLKRCPRDAPAVSRKSEGQKW